jgi:hypothetical protein
MKMIRQCRKDLGRFQDCCLRQFKPHQIYDCELNDREDFMPHTDLLQLIEACEHRVEVSPAILLAIVLSVIRELDTLR